MTKPLDPAKVRQLRELYKTVPTIKCKRLCGTSCRSIIDMSDTEEARIESAAGIRLPLWLKHQPGVTCPLLAELSSHDNHRDCTVYGLRPMICRLWGVSDSMRCKHGCVPDSGRWLTDTETLDLLIGSFDIGGHPLSENLAIAREVMMKRPDTAALFARLMRHDYSVVQQIQTIMAEYYPTPSAVRQA
jgi:hypothetical protein